MIEFGILAHGFSSLFLSDSDQEAGEFAIELASGLFSLALFALTMYAWNRRGRTPTLLLVGLAFLTFFVKQVLEVLPLNFANGELLSSILDFVALGLFFLAIVVRPRRQRIVAKEHGDQRTAPINDAERSA
jgi:uncharacterized RDD family membrane protein YckC